MASKLLLWRAMKPPRCFRPQSHRHFVGSRYCSSYENYNDASKHYDTCRQPVGLDVLQRVMSAAGNKLGRALHVLDGGCGTGNYLVPLHEFPEVANVVGLEIADGMRERAEAKAKGRTGITVLQGSILEPPFSQQSFDVVVLNQVLHHVDHSGPPFLQAEAALQAMKLLLRPGGALIVNFTDISHVESFWFWQFFRPQMERFLRTRFPSSQWFQTTLTRCGFLELHFEPVTDLLMHESMYLNQQGPEDKGWRRTNSEWSLLDSVELEEALARHRHLVATGNLDAVIHSSEQRRLMQGQSTTVVAWSL